MEGYLLGVPALRQGLSPSRVIHLQSVSTAQGPHLLLTHRPEECQHPLCSFCGKRPEQAVQKPYEDNAFVCGECRWPPCSGGCGRPRPQCFGYRVIDKPLWYCLECRPERCYTCSRCETLKPVSSFAVIVQNRAHNHRQRCLDCQHPQCSICMELSEQAVKEQYKDGAYACGMCCRPPCSGGCGQPRPTDWYHHVHRKPEWYCKQCKALPGSPVGGR
jgi:hypothetical protein